MVQNTFERREKKILLDESLLPDIEKRILRYFVPDPHNIDGKPYEICNIYFDNESRDVTRHSVSRPFYKEKLRLRSYGTPDLDSNVFFEIKRKMKKIGTKRRAILPLSGVYDFLENRIIPEDESFINRQVLSEIGYFIETYDVKPMVYIGYMRHAYFDKNDPSLRLTFDRDIVTRHTDLRLEAGRYGERLLPEGKLLMELKFSGGTPLWFARMMSDFGLTYERFSKVGREFTASIQKQIQNV
ncbi:MAG: polyphosphate polymerase domain-containing protein [Clostridia bacterium]|nr:polyphosphate polymerase domain-containing protein [Clostridia bacterium]